MYAKSWWAIRSGKEEEGRPRATPGASLILKHPILNAPIYVGNIGPKSDTAQLKGIMREEDVECIPGSPVVKPGV